MNDAIFILKNRVQHLKQYPRTEHLVKDCENALVLLEAVESTKSTNPVAEYAVKDALMTMALFVGIPNHVAERFIGLIAYVKELEEKAAKAAGA